MGNTPRRKPTPPKHLKRFQKKMRKATNTHWKLGRNAPPPTPRFIDGLDGLREDA